MPDLSPAAQAVLDAAYAQDHRFDHPSLAAVLRATADQMTGIIASDSPSKYVQGVEDSMAFLEAIATEMEADR